MKIILSLFFLIISYSSLSAAVISGQTKQMIAMNTGFNGTDLMVFGTLPHQDIQSVSLEILGPVRDFKTLNTDSKQEEIISLPSFYAGNASDKIPSFDKIGAYLTDHNLVQKMPDITLQDSTLFSSKVFLPSDAPVGEYKIKYEILDKSGYKHINHTTFLVKSVGLQHILYRLAMEYPLLNAILVIISATFMSHTIRFIMRKT